MPALDLQRLTPVLGMRDTLGDALLQSFQPLLFALVLGLQLLDGLDTGAGGCSAFALKLPTARLDAL
jgi:hypothetical protein